jgi:hypothetical protein
VRFNVSRSKPLLDTCDALPCLRAFELTFAHQDPKHAIQKIVLRTATQLDNVPRRWRASQADAGLDDSVYEPIIAFR